MNNILNDMVPIVAILSTIALPIGLGMYISLISARNKHRENMELIKQGIVPPPKTSPIPNKYRSLRNGFLFVAIGLGLIVGQVLTRMILVNAQSRVFWIGGSVLLFMGVAYFLFYQVVKDKDLDA